MEPSYYWLIAGAVFLTLEAFTIPGVGFLFAGIAAILTGVLVKTGVVGMESFYAQFAWFFALTAAIAAALWKKLKTWRLNPKGGTYDNMIGTTATVHGATITKNAPGQVMWSGALMNAELAADAQEIPPGARVEVVDVKGNTLIIKPKI